MPVQTKMPKALIIAGNSGYEPYCIPRPKDFSFDEELIEEGMPIMVRVKPDGDDKLRIVEIEGEPISEEIIENEKIPYIPEYDEE